MSDDPTQRGDQDRLRINVNQDYELQDWSKKFGVTSDELKKAVAEVGDRAEDVGKLLDRRRTPKRRAGDR